MATTFQRLNAPETSLESRQFTIMTASGRPSLCCPACSFVFVLPKGVNYANGGKTDYCVTCPAPTCGWWDYCVLDSIWEEM